MNLQLDYFDSVFLSRFRIRLHLNNNNSKLHFNSFDFNFCISSSSNGKKKHTTWILNGHFHFNGWVWFITYNSQIIELKVLDFIDSAFNLERWKGLWCAGYLQNKRNHTQIPITKMISWILQLPVASMAQYD